MSPATVQLQIERKAQIPTWFGIGGGADRFACPGSTEDLKRCLEIDPNLRILGDGANLLVDDPGVSELVVSLGQPPFNSVRWPETVNGSGSVTVIAGAGANLPKVITEAVRRGLAGVEGLGGIPATIGGAAVMNAGGSFGQFCEAIARIHAMDREGHEVTLERRVIPYAYRHSGLGGLIITSVELTLTPSDPVALRDQLKKVMAYKKSTQPMADRSAGCIFKNPTLTTAIEDIGNAGQRVSAGMLIDRAGCKGMRLGCAEVSPGHANFIVSSGGPGARAGDVLELLEEARRRVADRFGVLLEPEVVIWRRTA